MAIHAPFPTFTGTINRFVELDILNDMTLVERFLKYVSFDTQSSEETGVTPSTPGQMVFARYLKEELESLGLKEVTLDDNG